MNRRNFVKLITGTIYPLGLLTQFHSAQMQMLNIIIILADDLGFNVATTVETPNCDHLANSGMNFTDAHFTSSAHSWTIG